MGKVFRLLHYVVLIALSVAMLSCSKDSTNDPTPPGPTPTHEDEAINKKMDAYLKTHYLWNDDYVKLTPNYAQTYDAFLENQLMAMTTNIYDKKPDGEGGYYLYSMITRLGALKSASMATRGVNNGVDKKAKNSFGIAGLLPLTFVDKNNKPTDDMGLVVQAVYPNSPAAEAGIKRGFTIIKVNSENLTKNNCIDYQKKLLAPESAGMKCVLTENAAGLPTKEVTSKSLFPNPVLMTKVYTEGAHKIGYIVYEGFDAAYDDELLAALKTLKDNGANKMILDLRLNGGGHVISANMLSTCIGGTKSSGKVFQYYTYNKSRMATPEQTARATGNAYDAGKNKFSQTFYYGNYYGVDLRQYALNMPQLIAIVSGSTASSSEAVINSLKGIDVDVKLVGSTTSGKNVGMESVTLKDDRYSYSFSPITFQGYNAKEKDVDYRGIVPDNLVQDWIGYYGDFGTAADPCFAKAYELCSGVAPKQTKAAAPVRINAILVEDALPIYNYGREGMIQLPTKAQ